MLTYVFNLYWMLGIQAQWNTCTATSPAVVFLLQLLNRLPVIWPATATVVTMASSPMGAPSTGMLSVQPVTLLLFNAVSIIIIKDLTCTCSGYHMQPCAVGVPTSAFLLAWFVHVLTCSFISYALCRSHCWWGSWHCHCLFYLPCPHHCHTNCHLLLLRMWNSMFCSKKILISSTFDKELQITIRSFQHASCIQSAWRVAIYMHNSG